MANYNQNNLSQISMIKTLHNNNNNTVDQKLDSPRQMAIKRDHLKRRPDIIYSYRPIYYFSRFFGLLPFSLRYDSNGEIQMPKISKLDGVWFVISIVIYLALAKMVSLSIEIQKNASSPILILGNKLLLMFGLIYGAIMIVENMCSRFRFVGILKMFTAFDKEASQHFFLRIFGTKLRFFMVVSVFFIYFSFIDSKFWILFQL